MSVEERGQRGPYVDSLMALMALFMPFHKCCLVDVMQCPPFLFNPPRELFSTAYFRLLI